MQSGRKMDARLNGCKSIKSKKQTVNHHYQKKNKKEKKLQLAILLRTKYNGSVAKHQASSGGRKGSGRPSGIFGGAALYYPVYTKATHRYGIGQRQRQTAYDTCMAPQAAAAAALFMSLTELASSLCRRLSLSLQTDLKPTSHTQPWYAV